MKNKKYLKSHPYRIWQAADGRWKSFIPDPTKPNNKKLLAKKNKEDVEQLIIEYYKSLEAIATKITFEEMYTEWLTRHSIVVTKQTIERIEVDYNKYYKTAAFTTADIRSLKEYDLEYWLQKQIVQHNLSKTAYMNMQTIMKNTLIHAYKTERLNRDIWKEMRVNTSQLRQSSKAISESQVFNTEERSMLMQQALNDYLSNPNYVVPLMILLCDQLGVRNGELCALKVSDIVNNNEIWIQRQEIKYHDCNGKLVREVVEYTKSEAGNRKLILSEKAKTFLNYLPKDSEFLFTLRGKRVTCSKTDAYIRRLCKKVNIPSRSMHKIRKTYISTLFAVGLHPEKIREISGHDDMQTLYKNYCFCIEVERDIIAKINSAS